MKVLLAFNLYAYGKPERGLSYEYHNLYLPLQRIADEVVLFDFATLRDQHGRDGMNRMLLDTLRTERPDVALFALAQDEFLPDTIEEARRYTRIVAYFFDDIWRTEYVRHWAPYFDHFTTPIRSCYRRYRGAGLTGAIYSPFGYNDAIYRRSETPKRHDISFVGGNHPWRAWVIERLRKAGFDVFVRGAFWPGGPLEQDEMVKVFNASRINLNLSNARQWDARYLLSSWRGWRNTLRTAKHQDGIKARHFEIAGCGGFQLVYYAEDLERHFEIGDEIAVYLDFDDLVDKIGYFLEHEAERERIAAAGYERALRDHTAERRLGDLLASVTAGEAGSIPGRPDDEWEAAPS